MSSIRSSARQKIKLVEFEEEGHVDMSSDKNVHSLDTKLVKKPRGRPPRKASNVDSENVEDDNVEHPGHTEKTKKI